MPAPTRVFQGAEVFHRNRQKGKGGVGQENQTTFTATPLQVKWINAISSGLYKFLAIGGGIRGTKTFACLSAFVLLCKLFPRSRWAVVRKDLPTIRRNVVPSMNKIRLMAGGFVGELNQSTWTYTCRNGSEIILFPEQFTQDPELERWKGLEVNGFDLEEASELNEKSANKAIERAGSWVIPATPEDPNPQQPPPIVLFNFNPCANWPRKWFFEPYKNQTIKPPYYFLPATIADNPFASEDYKESLKYLPPDEYKRFVEGEWDFVDNPKQLIKMEWIWNALSVLPVDGDSRLSCDVARFGDDSSTIFKSKGNHLRTILEIKHFDTIKVGDKILEQAADPNLPVDGKNCRIDSVGVGGGTIDYVRSKGLPARDFVAGAKAIIRPGSLLRYKDLRAQAWWEFREKLRKGEICLQMYDAKGEPIPLPERLIGDLTGMEYDIDAGEKVITVSTKDEIKAILGRSTDMGDGCVTLFFDLPDTPSRPVLPGSVVLQQGH